MAAPSDHSNWAAFFLSHSNSIFRRPICSYNSVTSALSPWRSSPGRVNNSSAPSTSRRLTAAKATLALNPALCFDFRGIPVLLARGLFPGLRRVAFYLNPWSSFWGPLQSIYGPEAEFAVMPWDSGCFTTHCWVSLSPHKLRRFSWRLNAREYPW
jgi:hypothetical protein